METNQFYIRFEPLKLNVKLNDTVWFEGPIPQRAARKLHLIAERETHILATGDRVTSVSVTSQLHHPPFHCSSHHHSVPSCC